MCKKERNRRVGYPNLKATNHGKPKNRGKMMNPKNPKTKTQKKKKRKEKKKKAKSETCHNLYLCHKRKGKENVPQKEDAENSTTPRTGSEKSCKERLGKKILRAMIGSLGKVKGKVRRGEV